MINIKITKRDLLAIVLALRYANANLDDMNEAFEDEEDLGIVKAHGGDLFGTPILEREVDDLLSRLEVVAENHQA